MCNEARDVGYSLGTLGLTPLSAVSLVYGRTFTLRTDHHSLKWLHRFKDPERQVVGGALALAAFDYTCSGATGNNNADALSRGRCRPCGLEQADEDCESWNCSEISNPLLPAWTVEEIKTFQRNDPDLVKVLGAAVFHHST